MLLSTNPERLSKEKSKIKFSAIGNTGINFKEKNYNKMFSQVLIKLDKRKLELNKMF